MQNKKSLKLLFLLIFIRFSDELYADDQVVNSDCNVDNENSIENISINIHPIFDESNPDENNWLFRKVNALHINTNKNVIENDLLFKVGDIYDENLLRQSERTLRTRRYLNQVEITSTQDCSTSEEKTNTKVNVDVREVWTLLPEITFSHSGGESKYSAGLRDSNFLGLGKTLNIKHTSDSQRTGNLFQYYDPNLGSYDATMSLLYANNSDGAEKSFALIKPFISIETEWSAGVSYDKYEREDTLFDAGKEVDRFSHNYNCSSVFYGLKMGDANKESANRFLIGYTQEKNDFFPVLKPDASVLVPDGREFNYPWIEYQHTTDAYIRAYNIQQINRVEDINLGSEFNFRLGYASSQFSLYDNSYVINSNYKKAFSLGANQLLLTNVNASGLYQSEDFYNSQVLGDISYHWKNFNRGQFFVKLTAARGYRLFADAPLELGGDTGLRGYPLRYQAGDHLQLLNIEQRFFGQREWFSLFHVGAAIFYDQGRAWGESAILQSQSGTLRDFGIGLRISSTRTGNREEGAHNVVHIDIASPMDGGKDISKFQWLVKVKKGF